MVFNVTELESEIKDADIVVTGEGCLDRQTVMGKAPMRVAKLVKKYNAKVIAFAGSVTEEAMQSKKAKENLGAATEQVFRLIKTVSKLKVFNQN